MVNPDGVDLSLNQITPQMEEYIDIWGPYKKELNQWKANIRGVDINLNYPSGWDMAKEIKKEKGVYLPGPRDYPGANYLSEPESQNMVNITKIYNFDLTISLHSQGQEIYYEYQKKASKRAKELAQKFENESGYLAVEVPYNSSFAGYKDYFIDTYEKPGYTIEVGLGENPLPISEANNIYKAILPIFLLGAEKEESN